MVLLSFMMCVKTDNAKKYKKKKYKKYKQKYHVLSIVYKILLLFMVLIF